ncbi:unnamed protein product [Vicia faba]|uniref:Uncharacterized protein n=1 Tax=Vicia faba TaxID=3906 RepID=A0AAV0ZGD5_VICFA|nr:unnamed protein product [Vicia faba]
MNLPNFYSHYRKIGHGVHDCKLIWKNKNPKAPVHKCVSNTEVKANANDEKENVALIDVAGPILRDVVEDYNAAKEEDRIIEIPAKENIAIDETLLANNSQNFVEFPPEDTGSPVLNFVEAT